MNKRAFSQPQEAAELCSIGYMLDFRAKDRRKALWDLSQAGVRGVPEWRLREAIV